MPYAPSIDNSKTRLVCIRGKKIVKLFDEVGGSKDCLSISKTEFVPLMEAMGTAYCEEAHRRTINKIELDG